MHEIQSQILKQLTLTEKARYSEIKPPKIGGNQFAYHLKQVIDSGYVKKEENFYSLTEKGENFADTISMKTFTKRNQPKIVTMTLIKNKEDEILLIKKEKQPFIGRLFIPYGKIHLGERINEAATREIKEKTGLEIDKLSRRGDVYLAVYKGEDIISHMLCHIFETKIKNEKEIEKANGLWMDIKKIDFKKCIPGTKDILNTLSKKEKHFFKEIFVEV